MTDVHGKDEVSARRARRALSPPAAADLDRVLSALGRRLNGATPEEAAALLDLLAEVTAALELDGHAAGNRVALLRAEAQAKVNPRPDAGVWARARMAAAAAPPPEPARRGGFRATTAVLTLAISALCGAGAVVLLLSQREPPVATQRPELAAAEAPLALRPRLRPPSFPTESSTPETAPAPGAGGVASPGDSFAAVLKALQAGDAQAVGRLQKLADAGSPAAQLHLATLYQVGAPGLPRDPRAARRWTERAAQSGDKTAMHNLAIYLLKGEGGAVDTANAVAWLRKAALLGVADSQYNLGLLYESGRGLPRNLREAYRWYSLAAAGGDGQARAKAVEVEDLLLPRERAELDAEIATGRLQTASSTGATIVPPAGSVGETQQLLARLGLYVGPIDGEDSPALAAAARAYRQQASRAE